ncbi:MAG: protein kinase, partial [Chloroflexota bacterium]|nr:protein kinase [Chloroflexota bacterium]
MQLRRIGRYQLLEIVGKGGQGTVYRGHDPSTGQIVAVKILAEGHSDGDFLERFQREASILASIEHPHVTKVFDHGEEEGRHYIVTEYVPENLARIIEQGDPLPVRRALTVAAQIASALAVTHENGVTHRDVKPANVLISDSGDVKLTDFGIATADVMSTVTTPDATVGTPLYMSPEQIQSSEIDGRSDIYSLGCLLYQTITGIPPFQGESAYDIFNAHMNGEYEPLSSIIESCPEELDNLLRKALEKSLNDRFQSADEFMDAIDEVADQLPDTGDQTLATRVMPRTIRSLSRRNSIWKRRTTWMTGAAAVGILAIIGFAATTMLGDGSAVGLATGLPDATESSLVAQAPIIVPEEPAMAADMPIAENIIFSAGPDPEYLYAQIPVPDEADVGRLSNISAFTGGLEGNEAKLNVKSVKTDTLRAPHDVLLLRAMEIAVEADEIDTDTLRGIIEFQIKSQWIEESGILKDDIGLYRLKDEWQILPTTHTGSFIGSGDLFYERFSAETPGFSIFAIGITTSAQPENPAVQTQGAQPPEPTATKETVPTQQPTNNQSTQPPDSQSITEFPTPTPIAITDPQPSETATPEPVQAQPEPTATPIEITPQLPWFQIDLTPFLLTTTQEATGIPTATPKPTQMSSPTPVPSTPTPIPTPTPLPIELVKDGSMAQLSTGHHAFIEYPGDVDEWIYAPSSSMVGKPVSISVITDSTDSDGYLEFLSPSGNVIASDDDSGNNMNPLIGYVLLSEEGVYTVRFMTLDGTYGGYHLEIEPAGQTLPTATITPLPLATPTPLLTPTP